MVNGLSAVSGSIRLKCTSIPLAAQYHKSGIFLFLTFLRPGGYGSPFLTAVILINRCYPVVYVKFFVYMVYVLSDRFRAEEQFGSDLFIHQPF